MSDIENLQNQINQLESQLKIEEEDRNEAKQLSLYLLSGLLEIYSSSNSKKIKDIVNKTINKGKEAYPTIFK